MKKRKPLDIVARASKHCYGIISTVPRYAAFDGWLAGYRAAKRDTKPCSTYPKCACVAVGLRPGSVCGRNEAAQRDARRQRAK